MRVAAVMRWLKNLYRIFLILFIVVDNNELFVQHESQIDLLNKLYNLFWLKKIFFLIYFKASSFLAIAQRLSTKLEGLRMNKMLRNLHRWTKSVRLLESSLFICIRRNTNFLNSVTEIKIPLPFLRKHCMQLGDFKLTLPATSTDDLHI